jgi:hypothetical protein
MECQCQYRFDSKPGHKSVGHFWSPSPEIGHFWSPFSWAILNTSIINLTIGKSIYSIANENTRQPTIPLSPPGAQGKPGFIAWLFLFFGGGNRGLEPALLHYAAIQIMMSHSVPNRHFLMGVGNHSFCKWVKINKIQTKRFPTSVHLFQDGLDC